MNLHVLLLCRLLSQGLEFWVSGGAQRTTLRFRRRDYEKSASGKNEDFSGLGLWGFEEQQPIQ